MMKKTYEEKLIEMETSVTKSNDQNNILQNQIKEHQLEVNKLKDVIKVFSKPNVGSSEHFWFLHFLFIVLVIVLE